MPIWGRETNTLDKNRIFTCLAENSFHITEKHKTLKINRMSFQMPKKATNTIPCVFIQNFPYSVNVTCPKTFKCTGLELSLC